MNNSTPESELEPANRLRESFAPSLGALALATPPIAVTVAEFCRLTSLGKTTAYQLIKDGEIEVRRVRGRTLILTSSVHDLMRIRSTDSQS